MATRIGQIKAISRFPIKSMSGVDLGKSTLGWHGLAGDRRLGIRLIENQSGFPWLCASKLPELLLYKPCDFDDERDDLAPTRVRSPNGELLEIKGNRLTNEISERIGCSVEVMAMKHGIFDDAPISVIASRTIDHVCQRAGIPSDRRRFRANIVVDSDFAKPFAEDQWVGRVLKFGSVDSAPSIHVTKRDVRCKMIGLDPDTGQHEPLVLKTAVQLNDNHAGVYGTVISVGMISVGDSVYLSDA